MQQASNETPERKNQKEDTSVEKFQGTQLQESVKSQFELTSPSQGTTEQEKNMFCVNFLLFLNILHLSFLKQKLITFLSIGFKSMSLKRTIIYSVFLISFVTSVSFLNLNLAFKSVDRSPADAGHRLGLHETFRRCHGHLLSASCASDLCPVTTGNCHHFKYYWIIFTMSLLFLYKQLYNQRSKVLFVIISLIQFTIAFHSLNVVCHSKPSLNTMLRNSPAKEFFTIEVLLIINKMNFQQICTSNYSLLIKWRISTIACTWKWY